MKIAQIVPSLEARHGGPSRSVRGLAEGLALCGQQVELLTTGPLVAAHTGASALTTFAFPRQCPESIARSTSLSTHLGAHSYDIIHSHGLWQRTLHYAHAAARKTGAPLVISPRGMMSPWAWRHRRWKKRLASMLVHPGAFLGASGWHATSHEEAEDIRQLGFTQPICVAHNGVIPPSLAEEESAAANWRTFLPDLNGRRVALFYSRFHSKKRVLELIDLWLSKPRNDWVLLLAGIPEQYSVNELDSYITSNGGSGRIIVQDGANRPPPYALASLFLLPSHSENFGLVIAEALVRGVPVLTTDATPWRDLAVQGAGLCVSWENYSDALDSLLNESALSLQQSGQRARVWASETYSWEKAAQTILAFYDQLTHR
ncbi:glycosyltransferase [Rariglobus hedericola]|uniref:Glycosyltransferase n=1 Tax=Rariglobus hedericola TaxID=2597822 RepID=A0A556QPY5_9BACT|nr:glycosyltransferase [Rariglobus hedericola]TSJ78697.1 glycosyltransferase [Rariglobus hedericola]